MKIKKLVSLLLSLALLLSMAVVVEASADDMPSVAIVVAGTLGDRSFYDSSNEGITALNADFGTRVGVIECHEAMYESCLYDAAENYEVVCAVGWQFYDYLPTVAADYPDVKFLFIDNELSEIPENVMCVVYRQNEGSFLVGYIAGMLTKTGKVGAVGGEDSDTINDFIVGYEAGAKYANADVTVEVQYANDYEDPAKGKECALALYSAGCDIVFAVAGKTGEGVFEAAAETGNYAIGVDGDQKYINPDVIICSMVKQVGQSIYDCGSDMANRFQGGQVWTCDMATGYVDVVYGTEEMPQQVSDELKAQVDDIRTRIINGDIVVPTAFN